ncbi:MAG TPA: glycosyltransferase family 39 protein [Vicinamibacteria bacterium]|nr:glycosyltransferase family 39 protein [Vicinamibacteria bacterium]
MANSPEAASGDRHRLARRLAVLTLAALAVRVAFLLLEPATRPVGDERTWTDWARILSSERVGFSPMRVHLIFYPPVYPYFLAGLYASTGSFEAARWMQAGLGSLLVPAVGLAGARAFSPRVGLFAAATSAFYPELVWFSVHFWSETVFMALLWWAFERLLAADEGARLHTPVAAGLLWGAAVLTRETLLYFTPIAALWLLWRRPRGWTRGAAFLLAALLAVAPWTWRNWMVFGAFVPVSTAGGQNLFQGNTSIPRDTTYAMVDAVQGRIAQYRYAMGMGLQAIRDRQPWWIFEKLRDEMPRFWEADSLVLVHIKRGAYGPVPAAAAVATAVLVLLPYVSVLGLFALGASLVPRARPALLLLGFLAYYNLLHVATHGFARYRLPVMPIVFLVAGLGWSAWREGAVARMSVRRRTAAALLAAIFAVVLVPSFRLNLEHPAFGFTDSGGPPGEEAPPP